MPLKMLFQPSLNCSIGIWKISESLDELIHLSKNQYEQELMETSNIERKKQRIISRLLLTKMLDIDSVSISYDVNRKPFVEDQNCFFSISHTSEFVVVSLSSEKNTGIDIEKLSDRILRIESRFISDRDAKILDSFIDQLEAKYLVWGAKECMLKYVGDRKIDFKKHMQIKNFNFTDKGMFVAELNYGNIHEEFEINYLKIDDHVLTYIFK
ncbi:MAG: hypothetical protein CL663_05015 [Bacteroidetes bacterium]|nr:hypothetical protein [Bacteroidota bacterium]